MPWILGLFAFVHLGGIRVRDAPRFPRRGPAILVANHPATWVDVLVLHVALGRKLHFLADEHLYRPCVRAWLLRIFGALPVVTLGEASARETRNAETFRHCRRLLERGEVVAVFPEGVSATDRSLKRFRTGAARIARDRVETGRPVAVVPIGIHYFDRVAFRTRVVVSIGEAIHLPPVHAEGAPGRDEWIESVTGRLEHAVAELILDLPEPSLRATVEELAPLVTGVADGAEELERTRRLAGRVIALERDDPACFAALALHADRERRLRAALGLSPLPRTSRARIRRLAVTTALGAVPAAAGLLLHAIPALVTQRVARGFDSTRIALMRIGVGWLSFTLWYLAIATVAAWALRSGIGLAAPLAAAALGGWALVWSDGWRELWAHLRWRLAERREPRRMSQIRREQAMLLRLLDPPAREPRARAEREVVR